MRHLIGLDAVSPTLGHINRSNLMVGKIPKTRYYQKFEITFGWIISEYSKV